MNKGTLVVAAAAIGLFAYIYTSSGTEGEQAAEPVTIAGYLSESAQQQWRLRKDSPVLPGFLSENEEQRNALFQAPPYDQIELTRDGVTVVLNKEGEDEWKMSSPVASEVESFRIKTILEAFATDTVLTPASRISTEDERADFGLHGARAIRVVLKEGGVSKVTLTVGDRTKVGGGGQSGAPDVYDTFVLLNDNAEEVYRVEQKDLRQPVDHQIADFRSKKVFSFDITQVSQVTIENPENEGNPRIVLSANWTQPPTPPAEEGAEPPPEPEAVGTWALVEPTVEGFELTDLRSYWTSIANLRVTEFVMGEAPSAETGLTETATAAKVTVTVNDGEEAREIVIAVGAMKERDQSYYAQVLGRDEYMVISKFTRDSLLKSLGGLRDKDVLQITDEHPAKRIEIKNEHTGEGFMVLSHIGGMWTMEQPSGFNVDQGAINTLVSGLKHFRATDFLDEAPDMEATGLNAPAQIVKVTINGQEKTLLFGSIERDGNVTAHLEGSGLYFTVGSWTRNKFTKAPVEYRKKALLGVTDAALVTGLRLTHADENVALERVPGQGDVWSMTAPESLTAATGLQDAAVTGITNALKNFEVTGFSDMQSEAAGLASPAFTLVATLQDGSTREVRISDTRDGDNHYVSIVAPGIDPNAVYTLDQNKVMALRKKASDLKAATPAP